MDSFHAAILSVKNAFWWALPSHMVMTVGSPEEVEGYVVVFVVC